MEALELSVVVIARNEEAHIGRALESALAAVRGLAAEVILVDSASTDATVAVAERLGVRAIGLGASWQLSPAAGRHVGFHAASGRYVFFLDGDSALEPGRFMAAALRALEAEPRVAAVFGRRRELVRTGGGEARVVQEDSYAISGPRRWLPGDSVGGSGLYRAAALRETGGFNPWLCSYEEAELCTRLHDAGWLLLFIPQPMISHLDHRPLSVGEMRRRWRENLLLGRGQVLRLHPGRWPLYAGLSRPLGMLGCLAALPALALAAAASGEARLLLAWLALMAGLWGAYVARARSVKKPLFYFFIWVLAAAKLAQGFLRRPLDPTDYPMPNEVLRAAGRAQNGGADERPAGNHRLLEGG